MAGQVNRPGQDLVTRLGEERSEVRRQELMEEHGRCLWAPKDEECREMFRLRLKPKQMWRNLRPRCLKNHFTEEIPVVGECRRRGEKPDAMGHKVDRLRLVRPDCREVEFRMACQKNEGCHL